MTDTEKIMDLSTIWQQATFVFPHFGERQICWDEVYRSYLGRVLATKSEPEHALLMAEFINTLGDGHTDLSFKKEILEEAGYLPFALEYLADGYYLDGWRVERIDGIPMETLVEQAAKYVYRVGNFVPRLNYILPFLLPAGDHWVETEQGSRAFALQKQRILPKRRENVEFVRHGEVLQIIIDDLLRNHAPQIQERLEQWKPKAVILDLRENVGGMTIHGANIAQLFISGQFGGCQKWTRTMTGVGYASASQWVRMPEQERQRFLTDEKSKEEYLAAQRRMDLAEYEYYDDCWGKEGAQAVFTGPVFLLTSRKTVSAAEDLVAFFRTNHRATIIGMPTCGTSGTPLLKNLSCGTMRVCSVGYRLKDGTPWVGRGIEPDILICPTEADWRQNTDPVLETALFQAI